MKHAPELADENTGTAGMASTRESNFTGLHSDCFRRLSESGTGKRMARPEE